VSRKGLLSLSDGVKMGLDGTPPHHEPGPPARCGVSVRAHLPTWVTVPFVRAAMHASQLRAAHPFASKAGSPPLPTSLIENPLASHAGASKVYARP
jgi:hypothetical protein